MHLYRFHQVATLIGAISKILLMESFELWKKKGFGELRKEIEWVKVRTPNDAQAFGLYEGGSFGIAPELFQSGVFRPQYQPYEYKNVFAVGASIHPGGGVPIVMQGAKMLADHLIEQSSIQTVAKLS